jgi:hypothetical protein
MAILVTGAGRDTHDPYWYVPQRDVVCGGNSGGRRVLLSVPFLLCDPYCALRLVDAYVCMYICIVCTDVVRGDGCPGAIEYARRSPTSNTHCTLHNNNNNNNGAGPVLYQRLRLGLSLSDLPATGRFAPSCPLVP